jgi:hypothetical protein
MIALLLACVAPEDAPAAEDIACDDVADTQAVVAQTITFGRQEGGVSRGFDLDGHVSDDNDAEGCYQPDLVSPDGVEGIDNAFSTFLPIILATEGAAIEGLLQEAIDSGDLLFMVQLEDVDDPVNDTCINVSVLQGLGTPRLGTDGVLLSGQTFDIDPTVAPSRVEGLALVDGKVEARGIEMAIPMQIFDVSLLLELHDAALSLTLRPDGTASGYIGGGIEIQYLIDILEGRGDIAIADLAIDLLRTYADLYPDDSGTCPQLSAVLEFEATSAFLFENSASYFAE